MEGGMEDFSLARGSWSALSIPGCPPGGKSLNLMRANNKVQGHKLSASTRLPVSRSFRVSRTRLSSRDKAGAEES